MGLGDLGNPPMLDKVGEPIILWPAIPRLWIMNPGFLLYSHVPTCRFLDLVGYLSIAEAALFARVNNEVSRNNPTM